VREAVRRLREAKEGYEGCKTESWCGRGSQGKLEFKKSIFAASEV
jgi:hypothetical protein